MIALIAEAWLALQGVWRILSFKEGWGEYFNTSMGGLWHSFAAAIIALPLVALILTGAWYASGRIDGLEHFLVYTLSWVIFPLAASLAAAIIGVRDRWAAWVILHNWATVWLFAFQAAYWTLFVAGAFDLQILALIYIFYRNARFLVHWRIAYVALGVPAITAAFAAAVPVLIAEIMIVLISQALTPPV